jgi:HlyD family secretion protein
MEKDQYMDRRSEEVQEILGKPPGWILRFGTVLFFLIIVLLFWLSYWIKYPDVVENDIIISFNDPPIKLISPISGYVDFFNNKNNQRVKKGQLLVSFTSEADYKDVLSLNEELSKIKDVDKILSLALVENIRVGELQNDLLQCIELQNQYQQFLSGDGLLQKRKEIQKQITALENGVQYSINLRENLTIQIENTQIQLKNEEAMVKMDRLSQSELNKTRDKYVALVSNANATEAEIKDKQFKINNLKLEMIAIKQGGEKGRELTLLKLKDALIILKSKISRWINEHLVVSPAYGTLQITNNGLNSGQYVNKDEPLLMVIPDQSNKMKGIMNIPFSKGGNIEANQQVLVKVKSYPSAQFGILRGRVASISKVGLELNNQLVSQVIVYFNEGLVTTTGYKISTEQELSGTARIITKNKRLLQRLF